MGSDIKEIVECFAHFLPVASQPCNMAGYIHHICSSCFCRHEPCVCQQHHTDCPARHPRPDYIMSVPIVPTIVWVGACHLNSFSFLPLCLTTALTRMQSNYKYCVVTMIWTTLNDAVTCYVLHVVYLLRSALSLSLSKWSSFE